MSRFSRLLGGQDRQLRELQERLDEQAQRLDKQRDQLRRQGELIDAQQKRLERQASRSKDIQQAQTEDVADMTRMKVLLPVLEAQIASHEVRLQQLVERADTRPVVGTEPEQEQARHLLDEVRREHSLVRVRFGVISRYEERIRRLEAAIDPLPDQYAPTTATNDASGATDTAQPAEPDA